MRTLFLLISCALFINGLAYSQPKGVAFQKLAWKQVLQQASENGKLIFVDVYTSWCGPCKLLDRNVFSDNQLGSVFNRRFINLKIDAEKGEGLALAKAYQVSAYPTMLFINADGHLVHEVVGLVSASQLITESDVALSKRGGGSGLSFQGSESLQSLTDWNREYAQHKTDTSFLYSYIQVRHDNNVLDSNQLLDTYLQLLPVSQTYSIKNLLLISSCLETFDSQAGQLLAAHIYEADKLEGKGYSMGRTGGVAEATFEKAVAKRDTHILGVYNRISPVLAKLYSPYTMQDTMDSLDLLQVNRLRYLKAIGDTVAYLQAASLYVPAYLVSQTKEQLKTKDAYTERWFITPYQTGKEDSTQVPGFANIKKSLVQARTRAAANQLAFYASDYKLMKADRGQLTQALSWTKRAQQLIDESTYLLTEVSILDQLGRSEEARTQLEQGIAHFKAKQEDTKELEEVLRHHR